MEARVSLRQHLSEILEVRGLCFGPEIFTFCRLEAMVSVL